MKAPSGNSGSRTTAWWWARRSPNSRASSGASPTISADRNPYSRAGRKPVKMPALEERILVLAPTGRDSELACDILRKAGFLPLACPSLENVSDELQRGARSLLLAEEGLSARGMPRL